MRPLTIPVTTTLPAPPALRPHADALFLDLDGTLLEIAEHPDHVEVSVELLHLLQRLAGTMNGAIALLTGRTIANADAILGGAVANIAGVHGLEIRSADARIIVDNTDRAQLEPARAEAYELAQRLHLLLEDKGASLAIHFRNAPALASEVRASMEAIAVRHALRLLDGRMVLELIASHRTKGDALDAFMTRRPFAGRRPIAIGDDITDEHAFARAKALDGHGVIVSATRRTAASYALSGPADVFAWLKAALP